MILLLLVASGIPANALAEPIKVFAGYEWFTHGRMTGLGQCGLDCSTETSCKLDCDGMMGCGALGLKSLEMTKYSFSTDNGKLKLKTVDTQKGKIEFEIVSKLEREGNTLHDIHKVCSMSYVPKPKRDPEDTFSATAFRCVDMSGANGKSEGSFDLRMPAVSYYAELNCPIKVFGHDNAPGSSDQWYEFVQYLMNVEKISQPWGILACVENALTIPAEQLDKDIKELALSHRELTAKEEKRMSAYLTDQANIGINKCIDEWQDEAGKVAEDLKSRVRKYARNKFNAVYKVGFDKLTN